MIIIVLFALICVFLFLLVINENQDELKNKSIKQLILEWERKIKNQPTGAMNSINALNTSMTNLSHHITDITPRVKSQSTKETDEFSDNLQKLNDDLKTTIGKNYLSLQDLFNKIKSTFKEINNVAVKKIINHIPKDKINSFKEKWREMYYDINQVDSLMLKVKRNIKTQQKGIENTLSTLNLIVAHLQQNVNNKQ